MEDLFEQFNRHADVRMTDDERSAMRSRLQALAEATPIVRAAPAARSAAPAAKRPVFGAFGAAKAIPAMGLMVAVLFTAGGAYAAEGALPGDLLYPVKTHVIENVRSAITVSAEARAKWESERATRRLEEIEHLAATGKLDDEKAADLEAKFEAHATKVNDRLHEMREKGEDTVVAAAQHGSSLRAHERVLVRLEAGHPGVIASLAARVRAEAVETESHLDEDEGEAVEKEIVEDSSDEAAETEDGANEKAEPRAEHRIPTRTEAAAMGVRHAAQYKIAQLEKLADKWRDRIGEERLADMTAALDAAKAAYEEGDAQLEAGAHAEAFASFRLAHRKAQEAKGFGIVDLRFRSDDRAETHGDADGRSGDSRNDGDHADDSDGEEGTKKVEVRGWDSVNKDRVTVTASESSGDDADGRESDEAHEDDGDDLGIELDIDAEHDDEEAHGGIESGFRFRFGR